MADDISTPKDTTSCKQFTGFAQFSSHVQSAIASTKSHRELVYTQVEGNWGARIVDELSNDNLDGNNTRKHYNPATRVFWIRIMPTLLHNCHMQWYISCEDGWLVNNRITLQEKELLWKSSGDTLSFFEGPYTGARKEPDWLVRPDTLYLPSFVIESGWSESWNRLMDDMNLWLVGGQGKVSAVLILKWEKIGQSTSVRGFAEIYSLDSQGIPIRRQSEPIFPAPPSSGQQSIRIIRRALFVSALPPGRNGSDSFLMNLDELRNVAAQALSLMGLVPA